MPADADRRIQLDGRLPTVTALPEPSTGGPATGGPATGGPSTGGPSTGGPSTGEPAAQQPLTGTPGDGGRGIEWLDEDTLGDGVRQRRFDVLREGLRVPGLLWTPAEGGGPHPLVLLGHGGSGSKRQDYVAAMARRLVRDHAIAAAAIDGPVHGDRRVGPPAPSPLVIAEFAQLWANDGDTMTDSMVADWVVTLDGLRALPEIRNGPVGWWGVSMGTIIGLPFVASDSRVGAAVLGLMGLTGPTKARIARDAPRVRCPVLFLVQWDDSLFPHDAALGLWEVLGSPEKRLLAQPGDHGDLPADAFEASARFLARHLGADRR
jgi:dienelactone hydrolase